MYCLDGVAAAPIAAIIRSCAQCTASFSRRECSRSGLVRRNRPEHDKREEQHRCNDRQ